jgi:hypothetical protein
MTPGHGVERTIAEKALVTSGLPGRTSLIATQ